eukprot:6312361-Prymnesium_polylepis.2
MSLPAPHEPRRLRHRGHLVAHCPVVRRRRRRPLLVPPSRLAARPKVHKPANIGGSQTTPRLSRGVQLAAPNAAVQCLWFRYDHAAHMLT